MAANLARTQLAYLNIDIDTKEHLTDTNCSCFVIKYEYNFEKRIRCEKYEDAKNSTRDKTQSDEIDC